MLRTICLIDDDPVNTLICSSLLHKLQPGYEVEVFQDASSALRRLAASPTWPELILLDLNMPDLDGWDFLDGLEALSRPDHQLPPVFILTSSIRNSDRERAASIPAVCGYLPKPLTPQQIMGLLTPIAS